MPKVVFSNSKGLVQEAGSGVEFKNGTPSMKATHHTANDTLTEGGLHTAGGGARTLTVPAAANVPGQIFILRSTTAHAHHLTGSDSGVVSFVNPLIAAAGGGGQGGKLTLKNVAGASVTLICDGNKYLVLGNSGSLTFGGKIS